jgi:tRNA (guanine-N7-)-methyltransferase
MKPVVQEHLPIYHPDYRYPVSRNPYWGKLQELQKAVFSDNQTETHKGNWKAQIPDSPSRELHVEIGCNAGHVIVEWAQRNPEIAYIGLDWKFKIIFRGAEKALKRKLTNLIFFRAHAERLMHMFAPQELDGLYLYFPDPWPKKAQWKNRFVTAERLRQIAPLMKPNGIFHIKTDHAGYFEWMVKAIEEASDSWEVLEITRNLHEGNPAPEKLEIPDVTLFEKLFIREQIPINSVKLRPRKLN